VRGAGGQVPGGGKKKDAKEITHPLPQVVLTIDPPGRVVLTGARPPTLN
jgi:hypothetical protein